MSQRDWSAGWGDADEISIQEIDAMYPAPRMTHGVAGTVNPARPRPRYLLHLSKCDPETIVTEGLRIDVERAFRPHDGFNPPGIYLYDALPTTRRLFSRSQVELYVVDCLGLELEQDAWGGQGAWRCSEPIGPERLQHVHSYEPFERPLAPRYPQGLGMRGCQRPAAAA